MLIENDTIVWECFHPYRCWYSMGKKRFNKTFNVSTKFLLECQL